MKTLKVDRNPAYGPPAALSERSSRLWDAIVPAQARSAGRLALLTEALTSLDRLDEVRAVLRAEGLVHKTESTGALHVHPLVRVEKDSQGAFLRAWAMLNLQFSHEDSIPIR